MSREGAPFDFETNWRDMMVEFASRSPLMDDLRQALTDGKFEPDSYLHDLQLNEIGRRFVISPADTKEAFRLAIGAEKEDEHRE